MKMLHPRWKKQHLMAADDCLFTDTTQITGWVIFQYRNFLECRKFKQTNQSSKI